MAPSKGTPPDLRAASKSANQARKARSHDRTRFAFETRGTFRDRARHLVCPDTSRSHRAGVASVRGLLRRHRVRAHQLFPAPDGLDDRRRHRRSHRDDHAGAGVLGFRQFECPAGGDRVHRRAGGGEVGARPADQPFDGEPLRRLAARSCLQPGVHRRAHRAGVPQQHGARRRALPDRALHRQGSGLRARQPRGPAPRWLPYVLLDGRPRALFCPLADVQLLQPDRRADRAEFRVQYQLRQLAPPLLGANARRDADVAPARYETLFARCRSDTRGPRRGAQGSRRHGLDVDETSGSR